MAYDWELHRRPEQAIPPGNWLIWLILTGRGWGKTRTGSETVRHMVMTNQARRVALVGATAADVRDVMVEGPSGILSVCPPHERPEYQPSKRRLVWPNGAMAYLYTADEPDRLRGPQHDFAFCDELASWRYPEAWTNLLLGLRLGSQPRVVATTTPKRRPFLKEIIQDPRTYITRGSTYDNIDNLPQYYISQVIAKYEGTLLGRQEIYGEYIEEIPGALLQYHMIEACRVLYPPTLRRVVIGVDPATTASEESDETGIVAVGYGIDRQYYVLADESGRYTPIGWGRKILDLVQRLEADAIVVEVNQGGEMVRTILEMAAHNLGLSLPRIIEIHAKRGKLIRAEPSVALYEQKKVHHVGTFPQLEDQLCGWTINLDWSPDRLDALIYALTELQRHEGTPWEAIGLH
mgnify:CR=1 FL=1